MDSLRVKSLTANNRILIVDFECKGRVKKFFTANRFFASYSRSIEDVPESILIIPFLSTVAPIVWANHGDIYVKYVDSMYLDSLRQVQSILYGLFPKIGFSGEVFADKIVEGSNILRSKSMVLFSGGVDSLATFIRHREDQPLLIAIQGADIRLEDFRRWKSFTKELSQFTNRNNLGYRTVRSNFYDLFDHLLGYTFYKQLFEGSWWIAIMHSLSFVGLCAPLTYVDNVGKIFISASLTKEFKKSRGGVPEVDDKVYWSGTKCFHDGYNLSRQQKIDLISDYTRKQKNSFLLRVCGRRNLSFNSDQVSNCSSSGCEKCSRTIIGLELAGLNPNNFGFKVKPGFFTEVKNQLKGHRWSKFGYGEKFLWNDIYRFAKVRHNLPHSDAEKFVKWFLKTDIQTFTSVNFDNFITRLVLFFAPFFRYFPNWLWRINRAIYRSLTGS